MMPTSTRNLKLRQALAGFLLAGTALCPAVALAQSEAAAPAADQESDEGIGDIIVTANKRGDQKLQTTPTSIGVLTAQSLAQRNVVDIQAVTRNVAGINIINAGPGQNTIMVRGLVGAGESTVGLYYDNLVTSGTGDSASSAAGRQTDLLIYDAERVEVLRGPQSTLYGSSALAGVVRILSNQADVTKLAGRLDVEGAMVQHGGTSYSVKGMVNVPLGDRVAIRLVGYNVHDAGYIDNVSYGEKNFNSANTRGLRMNGKFIVDDRTTVTTQLYFQHLKSNGPADARPYNATIGGVAYPAVGELATDTQAREYFNDRTTLAGITLEHEFDKATVTLTQSYQRRKNASLDDEQGLGDFFRSLQRVGAFPNVPTPGPLGFRQTQVATLWNTEARVATNFDGPFNFVAGAFYQTRKMNIDNSFIDIDVATGETLPQNPLWFHRAADFRLKQMAAFGEATLKLTDRLSILGGIRVFKNKRHDISTSIIPFLRLGTPGAPDDVRSKESKVIFKGEADYKFNDDIMVYVSASQGYRAGGTIVRVIPELPGSYGPDYTWNYEAGAKTQWFDRKLQANLALYRIDWYDTQVMGQFFNGTYEGILNCKGVCARSQGIELDLTARPIHGLDLGFSGTVFKAKWTKDQPSINGSPLAGTQFTNTPRFTFNASAAYRWDLGRDLELELRGDVQHNGKVAFNDYRPEYNLQAPDAYTLVNTALTLSKSDRWSAKLFARNLFDQRAILNVTASNVMPYLALTAQPRTIGLQFSVQY